MDMEKEFVPYGLAVELIELGFVKKGFAGWCHPIDGYKPYLQFSQECEYDIEAPTFSQAFRWFREAYGTPSHIATYWQHDWSSYSYQYYFVENKKEWNGIEHYKTYEEAELACLRKLIDMAKEIITKDL